MKIKLSFQALNYALARMRAVWSYCHWVGPREVPSKRWGPKLTPPQKVASLTVIKQWEAQDRSLCPERGWSGLKINLGFLISARSLSVCCKPFACVCSLEVCYTINSAPSLREEPIELRNLKGKQRLNLQTHGILKTFRNCGAGDLDGKNRPKDKKGTVALGNSDHALKLSFLKSTILKSVIVFCFLYLSLFLLS